MFNKNMRDTLIHLALLTLIAKSNATSNKLKADCENGVCTCKEKQDNFGSVEFRVICEGNKTQEIILDDDIFKNEPKPDLTRKIYVRMTNFATLTVENTFLSKWQAYTSCSFDIWYCNAFFSSVTIPIAQHKAEFHVFAGIGVIDSDIYAFPPMIFRDKNEVGIKLSRSKLTHLDIARFGAKKVNYLTIKDSTIGKIGGTHNGSITLVYSDTRYQDGEVNMQNAKIGIIAKGGMIFNDYESRKAKVIVRGSYVGILEDGSISIGRKVSASITQSFIGLIPANALSIKESGKLAIERSVLTVKESALKNIICNKDIEITNNLLLPDDLFKNCFNRTLNNSANCENISAFMDHSCSNNNLVSIEEKKEKEPVIDTTTITIPVTHGHKTSTTLTTDSIPMVTNSSAEITSDVNQPMAGQLQHNGVPMGLFYLTIGMCLALLVMVIILTALVAWGKMSKKTYKPKDNGRNSDSYGDYDGPSVAYFAPKAPLPLSMRRNSKDEVNNEFQYYEN